MTAIVLVHGAWHGAWCWQRVLAPLWAAGHRVHPVTLTGVGERAHQLSPAITLQTHIEDVTRVIEAEELAQVLLVGHSYAGMVITGVADRMPARIQRMVYLDAVVPMPGESWSSRHGEATQAERRAAIAAHGCIPAAPPSAFGLEAEDADWVARRQTPQPGGVYDSPLQFDAQRIAALPRSFIDCTSPALATIAIARQRVREQAGWDLHEIATGHDAMVSAPAALISILLKLAST